VGLEGYFALMFSVLGGIVAICWFQDRGG